MSDLITSPLGDYRVEGPLGTSAIGPVYRGAHVHLGTPVMLVVVDGRHPSSPGFKTRWAQYAQQIAVAAHPHVIKTYLCGEQSGLHYIVMEPAGGGALKALPGSPEWNPVNWLSVTFIQQAAQGLAAIHARGLTHGDLKLSNLLLTNPDTMQAQVKVSEVGLRQLAGDSPAVGDLAALGGLLYEVMTGRPAAHASRGEFPSGAPDGLKTVVNRCLSDDPRLRFGSCEELAQVLGKIIDESKAAQTAAPDPVAERIALNIGQRTMVKPPAPPKHRSGKRVPPKPPDPLPAGDLVPCLHIFDDGHAPVARKFVTGSGITIGRDQNNTIVLPSMDISGTHARIEWDAHQRITITDLTSQNGTFYKGEQILPQVAQEWGPDQWVEVGPYWLWLQRPALGRARDEGIEVVLDQQSRKLELTPGRPAQCRFTLVNRKKEVDHFRLSVQGVPAEWVQVQGQKEPQVEGYGRTEVTMSINVPRSPTGKAGDYSVTIVAMPALSQDASGSATAVWTVLPFEDMSVSMSPARSGGLRQARYNLTIHHRGNFPASYVLTGSDDEKQLEFLLSANDFIDQTRLEIKDLPPGSKNVKLKVHAPKRWFGSSKSYSFGVQAAAIEPTQQSLNTEGQFLHKPIFPYWMMAVAPILLIGMLFLLPTLFRPVVRSVFLEPSAVGYKQPVEVFWDASRVGRMRILVNDVPVRPDPDSDATKYVFQNGFERDTRVRVLASNLFGEASREITITPPPPPPEKPPDPAVVELFEVTPLTIGRPDQEVRIRWRATKAARVELAPVGSVPLEGNATHSQPGDQTYTLTAFNSAGVPTVRTLNVRLRGGPTNPRDLLLTILSPNRKNKQGVTVVRVNREPVIFQWQAKDAKMVRIEGLGSAAPLTGGSGQKSALLLGVGTYEFRLIATNDQGQDVPSDPVRVEATCSRSWFSEALTAGLSGCKKAPQVQWQQ